MNVTFLGTSAANAYPEPFCQCANCEQARRLGGKSLRKRSSLLINHDLLIDLGPDVLTAANRYGHPLYGVRYCLQTHAHADHLDTSHLLSRSPGFGVVGAPRLHFYASRGTLREAARRLARDCAPASLFDAEVGARLNLAIHPIVALQAFTVGRYRVTAFPANHDPAMDPLLYAVEADGVRLFYGTDTADLPEATWCGIGQYGLRFDLVILDHTYGPDEPTRDHLSAHGLIEHAARMREEGMLTPHARIFATHIAHEGNPPHPDLAAFAARHGYEVAYDGLTVDLKTGDADERG
jgi:phosphoribosyl 1,2-cyclic phosphate phosphodiesterase